MGNSNSSTRESHARRNPNSQSSPTSASAAPGASNLQNAGDRNVYSSRGGRSGRSDLSALMHLGSRERMSEREAAPEPRRETKQEREARKLEKERVAREKERERSVREEGVDGGFLVTLGTYTGPEDFNKLVVRALMVERRLAPFWKGLDDHSDSWTENQLVAAVRGLPIPPADEIPLPPPPSSSSFSDLHRPTSRASNQIPSEAHVNSLTVPIPGRSQSYQSDHSANTALSQSNPSTSFLNNATAGSNFIRGRAKTLASPFTSKHASSSPAPQEVRLPDDPYVNGQPIEAYLYKDAAECPICFLYYPPYLNRTRCCDQPICSECFVQIKRPDPHPPEHHDDPSNPTPPPPPEEEGLLVSEPSACPFCVTPEFGVTYEPPTFRRGLVYCGPASRNPLTSQNSAMASTSSLQAPSHGRRRTTSLSASASQVITTDRVRPDWAKKLADARAHAMRRSAAATALHNAAYMLGNDQPQDSRGFSIGRRRRNPFSDSASGSGSGTPARLPDTHPLSHLSSLILHNDRPPGEPEAAPNHTGSRRDRMQDLEDLMMMEAIRMSLASEEERKKKEDKEAKNAEKQRAKDAKKAEKSMKKNGTLYNQDVNASTSTWTSLAPSSSNLAQSSTSPPFAPSTTGKGKAPVSADIFIASSPAKDPTSISNHPSEQNAETSAFSSTAHAPYNDAQRHLETQRATLSQSPASQQPSTSLTPDHRAHLRHLSNSSSVASSMADSGHHPRDDDSSLMQFPNVSGIQFDNENPETPDRDQSGSGTPGNGAGLEPMFNFRSLAAMIGDESDKFGQEDDENNNKNNDQIENHTKSDSEHHEFIEMLSSGHQQQQQQPVSGNASVASSSKQDTQTTATTRNRGDSGESSASSSSSPDTQSQVKGGAQREQEDGSVFNQKHSDATLIGGVARAHDGQIA